MMMFGGSPIRVAVPPMLDANTSEIRYGAAGRPEPRAHREGDRRDEQHRRDVVEHRATPRRHQDQQREQPARSALRRLGRPEREVLEEARSCFRIPTITIIPKSRKMTFQSIPRLLVEERGVGVDHADIVIAATPPRAAATRCTFSVAIRAYVTTKIAQARMSSTA